MPIIAVIPAAIAIGVAAEGVAVAGITAITALEVVAAVGATVSAVGAITKNKTLTIAGAAVGAIGGIGAFAASAGLLGADAASGASLFGPSAATGAGEGAAGAAGSASDLIDVPPAPPGMVGTTDAAGNLVTEPGAIPVASDGALQSVADGINQAGGVSTFNTAAENAAEPAAAAPAVADTSGGTINTAPPATTPDATTATSGDVIPPPPRPSGDLGSMDPTTGKTITSSVDQATGKIVTLPDEASTGMFSNILAFANKNPVATLGALQAGGALLSGLTSTVTPAQAAQLNAQAAQNQAAADLVNQQTKNLAMPKAVASLTPVTGTPAPIIPPQPPGLINNAPRLAAVTGAPA